MTKEKIKEMLRKSYNEMDFGLNAENIRSYEYVLEDKICDIYDMIDKIYPEDYGSLCVEHIQSKIESIIRGDV